MTLVPLRVQERDKASRRWRRVELIGVGSISELVNVQNAVAIRVGVRVHPEVAEVFELPPIRQARALAADPGPYLQVEAVGSAAYRPPLAAVQFVSPETVPSDAHSSVRVALACS